MPVWSSCGTTAGVSVVTNGVNGVSSRSSSWNIIWTCYIATRAHWPDRSRWNNDGKLDYGPPASIASGKPSSNVTANRADRADDRPAQAGSENRPPVASDRPFSRTQTASPKTVEGTRVCRLPSTKMVRGLSQCHLFPEIRKLTLPGPAQHGGTVRFGLEKTRPFVETGSSAENRTEAGGDLDHQITRSANGQAGVIV